MNDLSDEKDGSLMKTIVKEGDLDVWDRPKDPDLVTIKLSAKVAGASEYVVKDQETEFTVSDGHFCPAVKIAVSEMKKGEAVTLKVRHFQVNLMLFCHRADARMITGYDEGCVHNSAFIVTAWTSSC